MSRLATKELVRVFGTTRALDHVSVNFRKQSIHALLGENGAGKTTLIKALSGLEPPDAGIILVDESPVELKNPNDAFKHGVAVVQQELAMCPNLTLLENLVLGNEPMNFGRIDWQSAHRRAEMIAESIGVSIQWNSRAGDNVVGTLQQVEIIRCLFRGADTLLLDEPTAVLAPSQIKGLLDLLVRLKQNGNTIILITHKLAEALSVSDDVTVMRSGRVVHTGPANELSREELARHVVGDSIPRLARPKTQDFGNEMLKLNEAVIRGRHQQIGPISFALHEGEAVGVAGVAGNGQDELMEAVVGLRGLASGRIYLNGEDITKRSVKERRERGLSYISADRRHEGLSVTESLVDNVALGNHWKRPLTHGLLMSRSGMKSFAERTLDSFNVRYRSPTDPASSLSGGNQQKLVFGRELSGSPRLLVASQPTRGVDIKGIHELHTHLLRQRNESRAILLMSQELDELLTLCDLILVIFRGQIVEAVPVSDSRARDRIGNAMLGKVESLA